MSPLCRVSSKIDKKQINCLQRFLPHGSFCSGLTAGLLSDGFYTYCVNQIDFHAGKRNISANKILFFKAAGRLAGDFKKKTTSFKRHVTENTNMQAMRSLVRRPGGGYLSQRRRRHSRSVVKRKTDRRRTFRKSQVLSL